MGVKVNKEIFLIYVDTTYFITFFSIGIMTVVWGPSSEQ